LAKEARLVKGGTIWNRLAAATGLDFVAIGIAVAVLAQVKDVENSNDFVGLSNEVWGTYVLLLGFAAIFFFWFTSIFVARLRQVEEASGTSGRLANAVLASGTTFAGALGLCIAIQWAARMLGAEDLAVLSTAILEGPPLAFILATYIGAAGLAVFRAGDTVAAPSRIVAQLSLLLAPAYVAIGGIQIFKNYAWIDETGYIVFLVWVLAVSIIGVQRWGEIDEGWEPAPARPAEEPATLVFDEGPEPLSASERAVTASTPRKKPAASKQPGAKRKPAPRKR
jgi:hypothetical protein